MNSFKLFCMDAIEYLIQDHDKHRRLFTLLESNDKIYPELRSEIIHHVNQEEEVLYTPLLEAGLCEKEIRKAWKEHKDIMHLLQELDELPPEDKSWKPRVDRLRAQHLKHLEEEEKILFPQIENWISEKKLKGLKVKLKEQKRKKSADEILYPPNPGAHQKPPV